jgi:hypothetical protein
MSKELRAIVISSVIALALAAGLSAWQISFLGTDYLGMTHGISNGTFAVAVIYLSLGILSKLSRQGPMNGLRYITYTLRTKIAKFTHKDEADTTLMSYFDFLQKTEKKGQISAAFLLIPGAVCLFIAILATVLYSVAAS